MPNRVKRNSVVELMQKMPVIGTRGSLLTAIDKLLKTIDISESAIMIPTLLRDKCQFDAWELLIIAKILKASILGHSDLVEFYMNHIGLSQVSSCQQAFGAVSTNPNMSSQQIRSSATPLSPVDSMMSFYTIPQSEIDDKQESTLIREDIVDQESESSSCSRRSSSTISKSTGAWFTAKSSSSSSSVVARSNKDSVISTSSSDEAFDAIQDGREGVANSDVSMKNLEKFASDIVNGTNIDDTSSINSSKSNTNSCESASRDNFSLDLTNRLVISGQSKLKNGVNREGFDQNTSIPSPPNQSNEVKSSMNQTQSTNSSSQSKGENGQQNTNLNGPNNPPPLDSEDPGVSVKLLLQIEQLKLSIHYVTSLLENVVELYKKSIDNIAA